MLLRELIETIEEKYSPQLAYDWDNVGLLVGDFESQVNRILLSLDADEAVIEEAIEKKADLIITHHPFIFGGIKKINSRTGQGRSIMQLVKNGVALYSMHTNFDIAWDGLNDALCRRIGLLNISGLSAISGQPAGYEGAAIGRIAELQEETSLEEFAKSLKACLDVKVLKITGSPDKKLKRVAVVSGSGAEFIAQAHRLGAQVIVTGDVKYHQAQEAAALGICVVDAGHYGTEKIFAEIMVEYLRASINCTEILTSERSSDIFWDL